MRRWEGVRSPIAPHPLAVTVCEWDGVTAVLFCGQRVGRLAGGFGGWPVAPWLSQRELPSRMGFFVC